MKTSAGRFWEIDFLRGIALGMMLIYHLLADLEYLKPDLLIINTAFWNCFQTITATLFLLLAGLSLSIHYTRSHSTFYVYLLRGLKIFGWGCMISLTTKLALSEGYVIFGILHLIGLSTILAYPLFNLKTANLLIGISSILAGIYINQLSFPFSTLVWMGFIPNHFSSIDYFPLFPWFGLIVLGISLGQFFYPGNQAVFRLNDYCSIPLVHFIAKLGRHTLTIYIIHQPIFLIAIYLYLCLIQVPV